MSEDVELNRSERLGQLAGRLTAPLGWGLLVGGPSIPLFPRTGGGVGIIGCLVVFTVCAWPYKGRKLMDLPDSQKLLRLAAVTAVAVGLAAIGGRPSAYVTGAVLLFCFKTLSARAANQAGVALAVVALVGASWLAEPPALLTTGDAPTVGNIFRDLVRFALMLGLMKTAESERRRIEQLEQAQATAVADERARIARELHDVVAHHVSLMTIQAEAAKSALPKTATRAASALEVATEAGRTALTELRRLLGVLRAPSTEAELDPQPTLDDLERLVTETKSTGLAAKLVVEGEARPVSAGVGLSGYRIVQEALLNAKKHGRADSATVTVEYGEDAVTITVTDDGRGGGSESGPGTGNGLIGMQERAALVNGMLHAGPSPAGRGWVVRAVLPLESVTT